MRSASSNVAGRGRLHLDADGTRAAAMSASGLIAIAGFILGDSLVGDLRLPDGQVPRRSHSAIALGASQSPIELRRVRRSQSPLGSAA